MHYSSLNNTAGEILEGNVRGQSTQVSDREDPRKRVDESGEEEYDCRGGVKEEKEVFLLWVDAVKRIDVLCHLCAGVTQVCFWSAPMWCWCHINYMSLRQCVSGLLRDGRLCVRPSERLGSWALVCLLRKSCNVIPRLGLHTMWCVCVCEYVALCACVLSTSASVWVCRGWECEFAIRNTHTHVRYSHLVGTCHCHNASPSPLPWR